MVMVLDPQKTLVKYKSTVLILLSIMNSHLLHLQLMTLSIMGEGCLLLLSF